MTEEEKLQEYLATDDEAEKVEIFYKNHPEIIYGALKKVKVCRLRKELEYRDWYQVAVVGFMDGYRAFPYKVALMPDYQKLKNFTYRSSMWHLMREIEKMKRIAPPMEEESLHWWMDSVSPDQNCTEILSVLEESMPKLTVGELQFLEGRLVHRLTIPEMAELYGITRQALYKRRDSLKVKYEALLED